ncbi:tripartite motif-containing protein 45-like [Mytilus californianus]|uniref:tripartite motif-containing protein 45-like n=1 Tax=Mytilus californianus TaxID=6549 RepID=UPI00224708E7|nr:tripartite motif-containing protein 45-like [Mytilus californianus]XP_052094941.1 tripartite motif-containing protein 45-like [Mytilus californianus]
MAGPAFKGTLTLTTSQLKQKFLCCSGCSNEYDDIENFARLLPCLHSMCNQCVHNLAKDGVLPCPECDQKHEFKGDVSSFPRDNTRQDLMDFVRVKLAPGAIICQSCGDTKQASFRCKNCSEFLCEECHVAHKRTNVTRGHELLELQSLQKKENLDAFCHQQKCPDHDRELELYCNKDDCQKPICFICALLTHKQELGHDIKEILKISIEKKDGMRKRIDDVNMTGREIKQIIESIGREVQSVRALGKEVATEINNNFDHYIQTLEKRRDELKRDVDKYVQIKAGTLENQLRNLKQQQKHINEAAEFADQTLLYNNPPAFLQIEGTVVDRLDKLHNEWFDKEPHEVATIGFNCKGLSQEIQNKVSTMAKVWSSNAYQPNTKITPKQNDAVQDETVTFLVVLCNYVGKPLTEDVGHLKATLTDPNGATVDVRVIQNGSEEFRVTFVPFYAGSYKLDVSILDKPLGEHEFQVQPRDKPQGSNIDASQLDGATRPDFTLERKKAHRDVTVTPDGKTFVNSPSGTLMESTKDRLHKFKGTYGNTLFTSPGKFYYEVNIRYKIRSQLEKSNLVFELGLARRNEMDKKHVVDGQPHAWSMICSQHVDCDAICLHIARGGKCLFHETLSKNAIGCTMDKTFGFLLDATSGVWRIFDASKNKSICQMDDVDCSEPLVPVVSGYNPNQVEVTMTLCTGDEE